MPNTPKDPYDAFKTELKLAILTLKEDLQRDIREASTGILTEVRERLRTNETDRNAFYTEVKGGINTLEGLARETNGQVKRHGITLYGDDRDGSDGLVRQTKANTNWRNAMLTAGGVVAFFAWLAWAAWGADIRERGIINRPAGDYVEFVDARIKQWIPHVDKPVEPAPNLVPKNKDGTLNPN